MKYSLITMKPNIMRKTYYSKILHKKLKLTVSMKANRCIKKKGDIDKYLLKTDPKKIDSKFGQYLRQRLEDV